MWRFFFFKIYSFILKYNKNAIHTVTTFHSFTAIDTFAIDTVIQYRPHIVWKTYRISQLKHRQRRSRNKCSKHRLRTSNIQQYMNQNCLMLPNEVSNQWVCIFWGCWLSVHLKTHVFLFMFWASVHTELAFLLMKTMFFWKHYPKWIHLKRIEIDRNRYSCLHLCLLCTRHITVMQRP